MNVASRFIAEIRFPPKFAAAAEQNPQWLDQLDALTAALEAVYASHHASAVEASDHITAIIRRTAPLKARLLAVNDVLAGLIREVN